MEANIHPMWLIDEYAIIFGKNVWLFPIIPLINMQEIILNLK